MMTAVAARRATLVSTVIGHSALNAMILAISPKTAPRKLSCQGFPVIIIDLSPTHIITTATGTGHSPSITDTAKGTTLTGQDHAIDPSTTEAPVTIGDTYPILYLTTIAILITPLLTCTLEDIPTGIPHTNKGVTHLVTHHAGATPNITPLIVVSPAPGTPWGLLIDHAPGKYQSHVHRQRPPIDLSVTRRSPFRTYK